jgi:hypothetical protein
MAIVQRNLALLSLNNIYIDIFLNRISILFEYSAQRNSKGKDEAYEHFSWVGVFLLR